MRRIFFSFSMMISCVFLLFFASGTQTVNVVAETTVSSRRERLQEEAELVARLARILVEEERALEKEEEGFEKVAMPREEEEEFEKKTKTFAVLEEEKEERTLPPPPTTKNPDAKFLYDLSKAFVRTARQQFPKEIAESDDYAM